ncbi:death domain-containing membrane protein NRADD-like [Anomalospiza imberbis]|uniref:death domain-containing membrane protein NRADD-like n=1 Tax=Anomalospiza imberbis TaxID=187417 RepID=UPI0035901A48
MRPLPVPLLLLLLSPVPGRGGGCPPCPRGVPEPCDSRCPPCARTPSPAEEEPEEPCPPCPPCSHEAAAPLPEGTRPAPGAPPEPPGDIIPLYCALLAGLVVGLVAYVAFKCWDTCRRKRQLDKARDAGDAAGPAADAEKLRGDGGVSPDSGGPEPPQPPPHEGPSLLPVSPRRPEEPGELERLLELGAPGSDRRGPGPAVAPGDVTSAV